MLTLVRGLPGSGKSTFAKNLGIYHVEADMFFMKNGEYKFDVSKLAEAHTWCKIMCCQALDKGIDVVVSNTFTTEKEWKSYLFFAKEMNAEVKIYRLETMYMNTHNVPTATLIAMRDRFENLPGEIIIN